jgi:putative endonuclease
MGYYYVYILASQREGTLYVGVTNDLERRMAEHKAGLSAFTAKYKVAKLVWFDYFTFANDAIAAEKRIKGWSRAKKIALIEQRNPKWVDLTFGF